MERSTADYVTYLTEIAETNNIPDDKKFLDMFYEMQNKYGNEGIPKELFDVILRVITLEPSKVDLKRFQIMVCTSFSQDMVAEDEIDKVLRWVVKNSRRSELKGKVDFALQWVASITQYGLIDLNVMRNYYRLIIYMMDLYPEPCCQLLYMLSNDEVYEPSLASRMYKCWEKRGSDYFLLPLGEIQNNVMAKLAGKKKLPHPGKAFLRKGWMYVLLDKKIAECCNRLGKIPIFASDLMRKKIVPIASSATRKRQTRLNAVEAHFKLSRTAVWEDCKDLCDNLKAILILQYGPSHLRTRFLENVYPRLSCAFIKNAMADEKRVLEITQVAELSCEGFLPIAKFLEVYLLSWDGRKYEEYILNLIPWYARSNIEYAQSRFITPLSDLFFSSNARDMSKIIGSLVELLLNVHFACKRLKGHFSAPIFGGVFKSSNEVLAFANVVTEFVVFLTTWACFAHPCNAVILQKCISNFQKIFHSEMENKIPKMTVVPKILVSQIMLSFDCSLANELCGLMYFYHDEGRKKIWFQSDPNYTKIFESVLPQYAKMMYLLLWKGEEEQNEINYDSRLALDEVESHYYGSTLIPLWFSYAKEHRFPTYEMRQDRITDAINENGYPYLADFLSKCSSNPINPYSPE